MNSFLKNNMYIGGAFNKDTPPQMILNKFSTQDRIYIKLYIKEQEVEDCVDSSRNEENMANKNV